MTHFKAHSPFAILSLSALAVVIFSGTACQPPEKQATPPEKITIAYSTASNAMLMYVALAKGYFAAEGLDATPQPHAFGQPALQSFLFGIA